MATKKKKRKPTTKKSTSTPKSKSKLSWSEEANTILQSILKRAKNPRSAIFVLSQGGDFILEAGKVQKVDKTSVGALASALRGLKSELNHQLKTKASWVLFGDEDQGFRVDYFENWIIIAVQVPYTSEWKRLQQHLKKYRLGNKSNRNASEALAGLSEAAVDMAVKPY